MAVFPAKAGTRIHPERFVGFTWAWAFAGEAEETWLNFSRAAAA